MDVPDTVERAKPEEYGGSWEAGLRGCDSTLDSTLASMALEALLTGLAPGTEYEVQDSSDGRGSKLSRQGTAGFGPCCHLPGFLFGTYL